MTWGVFPQRELIQVGMALHLTTGGRALYIEYSLARLGAFAAHASTASDPIDISLLKCLL